MFLRRKKKNKVYPCKHQFYYIKVGLKGSKLYRLLFVMGDICSLSEFNAVYEKIFIKPSLLFLFFCVLFVCKAFRFLLRVCYAFDKK